MAKHLNVEIKAKCSEENQAKIRQFLESHATEKRGVDHQIDTYFNCPNGRLKLRQGNIEKNLIFYQRDNQAGPKQSHVNLYKPNGDDDLKQLLTNSFGVMVEVDKQREIYFIENVKFHLDTVKGLGTFMEIEAIESETKNTQELLQEQCESFMNEFSIADEDLLHNSYSDMLL